MNTFEWKKAKQLTPLGIILVFLLPSAFAFTGFRIVLPALVRSGTSELIGWPAVASAMLLILVLLALLLHKAESNKLKISWAARMCFKKLSWKQWLLYIGMLIVSVVLSMLAVRLVAPFIKITGMTIPDYMPFFLNPTINPGETDPAVLSPGLVLRGNYAILPLMAVTLLLNILGEELYFRAWVLPKMVKYGPWAWILNGILFALYHSYQLWLLPTLLVTSLFSAFVVYRSKSVWPAIAVHLVANFLISILSITMLIAG